jgi:hypothetical protein
MNLDAIMESSSNARDQRRRNARRQTPIAAEFEDCVQLFYQLCSAMDADSATWEGSSTPINDLFSKFKAWGNDTRASSRFLDYTLRKASRLRDQVLELLKPFKLEIQSGKFISVARPRVNLFFLGGELGGRTL